MKNERKSGTTQVMTNNKTSTVPKENPRSYTLFPCHEEMWHFDRKGHRAFVDSGDWFGLICHYPDGSTRCNSHAFDKWPLEGRPVARWWGRSYKHKLADKIEAEEIATIKRRKNKSQSPALKRERVTHSNSNSKQC